MSTRLNARSDAKLKRLDDPIIVEIVRRRTTAGVKDADILTWLQAEHGVSSSPAALSESFPYLEARARSWQREQRIAAWMDDEKSAHPELSDEELFTRGQRRMELLTIADEDPDAWAKVQRTRRDKESLALDSQKFQRETCELFLKWFADQRAKDVLNSTATNADKIERLGQLMFGETWK